MSGVIGVGVGDIIAVSVLARKVYRKCRDCPGEYNALAQDAQSLRDLLEDLQDLAESHTLSPRDEKKLRERSDGCHELLQEMDAILDKYSSLPTASRVTWDRLGWDQQAGRDIRGRLTANVTMLSTFYHGLTHSSMVRVEQALEQLVKEIQQGHREATSVVSLSTAAEEDEDAAWPEIIKELKDLGVTEAMAVEHRAFIVDYFVKAVNDGLLQENAGAGTEHDTLPLGASAASPIEPSPVPGPLNPAGLGLIPVRSETSTAVGSDSITPWNSNTSVPTVARHSVAGGVAPCPSASSQQPPSTTLTPPLPPRPRSNTMGEDCILLNAHRIVHHWNLKDWPKAAQYLQQQMDLVKAGQTNIVRGIVCQPDLRVLRHLMGVCASFQGDLLRAKALFESVWEHPFNGGATMDEGDIAAARWLGDTCIQLDEMRNASLAWAISLDGIVAKEGFKNERAARLLNELRELEQCTKGLSSLNYCFSRDNTDASTIFLTTAETIKSGLIASALTQVTKPPYNINFARKREKMNILVAEGFLIQPLISTAYWPLPFDPLFSAESAARFLGQINKPKTGLQFDKIPTVGMSHLRASKSLDYVTKKDVQWLVDAVKASLRHYQLEFRELPTSILCRMCLSQDKIAVYEGFEIMLRKVPLRSVVGIKVGETLYRTRCISPHATTATGNPSPFPPSQQKTYVVDRIKEYMEEVVKNPALLVPPKVVEPPKLEGNLFEAAGTPLKPTATPELYGGPVLQPNALRPSVSPVNMRNSVELPGQTVVPPGELQMSMSQPGLRHSAELAGQPVMQASWLQSSVSQPHLRTASSYNNITGQLAKDTFAGESQAPRQSVSPPVPVFELDGMSLSDTTGHGHASAHPP